MAARMADVRLETVCKSFGKTEAVRELSLEIGDGEFVVLLGPTGAGKTTTLRLVAGLERPDAGRVAIAGRDVTAAPPVSVMKSRRLITQYLPCVRSQR